MTRIVLLVLVLTIHIRYPLVRLSQPPKQTDTLELEGRETGMGRTGEMRNAQRKLLRAAGPCWATACVRCDFESHLRVNNLHTRPPNSICREL